MKAGGQLGLLALALLGLAACSPLDAQQARTCERIVPALEAPDATIRLIGRRALEAADAAVRIDYEVAAPGEPVRRRHVVCGFGGGRWTPERLRLETVTTAEGALTPVQVFMLRSFWLDRYERQGAFGRTPAPPPAGLGYGLQLLANALVLASIYALLATSFTIVFALTRRINLAFGALAVLGAYAAFAGIGLGGTALLPLLLPLLLLAVALYGAILGLAFERVLFRPLAGSGSQALLIASLGLAICLEEALRLLQGAGERWVPPLLANGWTVLRAGGFPVTLTPAQIGCALTGLAAFAGLHVLCHRTAFGRCLRAAADDPEMAALCGVRTPVLRARTLALCGGLAALAGAVLLLRYGTVGSHDGWLITFKALTAAVVGGIGRIGGAALGALLIALMETFWAGYLGSAWRDVATFALLALVLALRPAGLLGDTGHALRLQRPRA